MRSGFFVHCLPFSVYCFLVITCTPALAVAPTVSNVVAHQRTDGSKMVDIYYNLADSDTQTLYVSVKASSDGGATNDVTIASISGDIGPNVSRGTGKHIVWDSSKDLVSGTYGTNYKVCVTAIDDGCTRLNCNIGLYLNTDWQHEYPTRPMPGLPADVWGFYGVAVNKQSSSPYCGRIYVTHAGQQDIFIYSPDGSFIGEVNDQGIAWGPSAPWDISIADDGYIYVADRSNQVIYCFAPDGQSLVSTSPQVTYSRAIFARKTNDGITHIFVSGDVSSPPRRCKVYEITLGSDHVTWGVKRIAYEFPAGYYGYFAGGMWVSADLGTVYQAWPDDDGPNRGVTKFVRNANGEYLQEWCRNNVTYPVDVDVTPDGKYLWITNFQQHSHTASPPTHGIYRMDLSTGSLQSFDTISYGKNCCVDRFGNVAVTFGKAALSWPSYYWGMFAAP